MFVLARKDFTTETVAYAPLKIQQRIPEQISSNGYQYNILDANVSEMN